MRLVTLTKTVLPSPFLPLLWTRLSSSLLLLLGRLKYAEKRSRSVDAVLALRFRADLRPPAFLPGVAGEDDGSGSSTKYEPRTTSVMGTEQLPADLMALRANKKSARSSEMFQA